MQIEIVYEDDYIIVVNKPAGLLCQGGSILGAKAPKQPTVYNYLLKYLASKGDTVSNVGRTIGKNNNDCRTALKIIHRLDSHVSGLLVFAKSINAAAQLSLDFNKRIVNKHYVAVLRGNLPVTTKPIIIEDSLLISKFHNDHTGQKEIIAKNSVKEASLQYQSLLNFTSPLGEALSFVLIKPITGRKHQIRVQMASRGYPIYGDLKYGDLTRERIHKSPWIALHAFRLELQHPINRNSLAVEAFIPKSWVDCFGIQFYSRAVNLIKSRFV